MDSLPDKEREAQLTSNMQHTLLIVVTSGDNEENKFQSIKRFINSCTHFDILFKLHIVECTLPLRSDKQPSFSSPIQCTAQ